MKFVNIRIETIKDKQNFIERIKHNTRFKKDNRVVNDKGFIDENGNIIKGFNSDYAKEKVEQLKLEYDNIVNENKRLNKQFRKSRTKSISEGILYFSKGINEDFKNNPNSFKKRLTDMFEEFQTTYKTDIITYQTHTDEAGNVHVHFMFKNYNKETGKALNFTRNAKNGSALQDLAYKYYKTYGQGYQRGLKRHKKLKHLSIEEYKQAQDSIKLIKRIKKDKEVLLKQNKQLKEQNEQLKQEIDTIRSDFIEILNDIKDFVNTQEQAAKTKKWLELFDRYNKNENIEKRNKLITKVKKVKAKLNIP